ncbi:MAG TPA: hybrid sensor histidine kinase/response regulator [Opitutaceae bacterium]|nr:hybrid sensor histidine kinase/response regulator [Opitutaceae bacterium]
MSRCGRQRLHRQTREHGSTAVLDARLALSVRTQMDQPINILIVDDEPKNLVVLETVLDHPSYRLVRAGSAEQALLALVTEEFALLILDIRMPGMTGIELARMVKERKKTAGVPIIFLTAYYSEDQHVLEGYGSGAVDYLHKPVNAAILRSKVAVFAELHAKNREVELMNHALRSEVSERRMAEEKLQKLVEDLEVFSYSLAHDLRSPLRAMRGFADILISDYAGHLNDEAQGYLRRISTAAERMDELVRDILSYTKVARGDFPLVAVDVGKLIQDVTAIYPPLQSGHADISVAPDLPQVLANEAALTQVISNLLGNAVKFVRPGVRPQVEIRGEEADGYVRLWFEDNGIGIPKEAHDKLFNLFMRLHQKEEYEGTGIGLAIVRKAASRMGGTVGVESDAGRGSRFWVQLKKAHDAPLPARMAEKALPT